MTEDVKKSLSIIIPTYNRSHQIDKTLKSISDAELPQDMMVEVIVVDNNSQPDHGLRYRELVESYQKKIKLRYEFEKKQGRSHACNRGLNAASSDWVGFIDDDEALDRRWLIQAMHWIESAQADYVGGPCLPDWEKSPPDWLPAHAGQYRGILGWIELSHAVVSYDDFDGELCGGNFIARTDLLIQLGGFNTNLGRSAGNLLGGEDGDLHTRLKAAHARGYYDPAFSILHSVPSERMTLRYHFRWAYWSGVANGIRIDNGDSRREDVPYAFGVPRYWFSKAFRGTFIFLAETCCGRLKKNSRAVVGLMDFFYLLGMLLGKNALKFK
ncbi:glycosyltransferase [Diaphorobacter sp.]|uniref:glycosyltransferase n=1 Tax=Diaphorobacter sp. TaxID=1934310 RepID=UPI003D0A6819